jgi:hypothetical protein
MRLRGLSLASLATHVRMLQAFKEAETCLVVHNYFFLHVPILSTH